MGEGEATGVGVKGGVGTVSAICTTTLSGVALADCARALGEATPERSRSARAPDQDRRKACFTKNPPNRNENKSWLWALPRETCGTAGDTGGTRLRRARAESRTGI